MALGGIETVIKVVAHTFYIADSSLAMQYYDDLQKQLENAWPKFPPINPTDRAIPKPLVALTSCNALAGGLAFTTANSPLSDDLAIWINAVLVAPEYRRQGVGSSLIRAAQEATRRAGVPRLYALTELPDLYSKLNWSMLSSDGADFVLTWNCGVRRSDGKRSS